MPDYQEFEEIRIDIDDPVFTTGVVIRLTSIPLWALKQLDDEGLVSPPREARKARLYSHRDLKRIQRIWFLMETRKISVNGVKAIFDVVQGKFKLE